MLRPVSRSVPATCDVTVTEAGAVVQDEAVAHALGRHAVDDLDAVVVGVRTHERVPVDHPPDHVHDPGVVERGRDVPGLAARRAWHG